MNLKKLINKLLGRPTITLAQRLITRHTLRRANALRCAGFNPTPIAPHFKRPDIRTSAAIAMRATKPMFDAHSRAHVDRVMQQLYAMRTNKPD